MLMTTTLLEHEQGYGGEDHSQRLMKLKCAKRRGQEDFSRRARYQDLLKVETDSSSNVLVMRQPLCNHVGVVYDVATEQEAAADGHDEVEGSRERNKDSDKASRH